MKNHQNLKKLTFVASWGLLEAFGNLLERLWRVLERLKSLLGRLGAKEEPQKHST